MIVEKTICLLFRLQEVIIYMIGGITYEEVYSHFMLKQTNAVIFVLFKGAGGASIPSSKHTVARGARRLSRAQFRIVHCRCRRCSQRLNTLVKKKKEKTNKTVEK